MKLHRTSLGSWVRALLAALLLAGVGASAQLVPRDAAVALATIVVSIGFPLSLARATLPPHADAGPVRLAPRTRSADSRRRQPPAEARARRAAPPPFLRNCALLC